MGEDNKRILRLSYIIKLVLFAGLKEHRKKLNCKSWIAYFLKLTISILIEFVQLSVDDSGRLNEERKISNL